MRAILKIAFPIAAVESLDNGVGLTPAMGYNTWNDFRCGGINAENVKKVADAFIAYGLDKVGYEYVNIDDCWAVSRDSTTGVIVEDPQAFPEGMKAVADYVHGHGLKFGIYTDRGTATCVGRPGSQDHEAIDAQTYAAWGVDFLKEDSCNAPGDHQEAIAQYALMRDALNATGRPIYFSLCGWSSWYAPEGAKLGHAWRYGYDVNNWNGAWSNSIAPSPSLAQYAGPGAWNDPDALIGSTEGSAVTLSKTQSRTQFSLWAMMAAPLSIGSNILGMSAYDLETYKNTEVIAVDQDVLGKQGTVVWDNCGSRAHAEPWQAIERQAQRRADARLGLDALSRDSCATIPDCQQVWLRELQDGYALAFVNYTRTDHQALRSAGNGPLVLEPCDDTQESQLWNIQNEAVFSRIAAVAGDKACWEVNGCGYGDGSTVDTNYGCKDLPSYVHDDACCSNMAWELGQNGSIRSGYDDSRCLEVRSGGGTLAACEAGKAAQQWTVQGEHGRQQIAAGDSRGCIARSAALASSSGVLDTAALTFDVSTLGWASAYVRDLVAHEDMGATSEVKVQLSGDGDSRIFKLTQADFTI